MCHRISSLESKGFFLEQITEMACEAGLNMPDKLRRFLTTIIVRSYV